MDPQTTIPGAKYLSIAPGRVNLLGEHVDYNDGIVLPAAIDRVVQLAAAPLAGRRVTLRALDLNQQVEFSLDGLSEKRDLHGAPLPEWALYPAGVAWALQENGFTVSGFNGAFSSNIPMGSGLSSSAAVELAFAALWQALEGWQVSRLKLAQMAQQAERAYVGVNCGLMDQFASAHGVADCAVMFDTRSLEFRSVPLPANTAIVIADSRMPRKLTSSAYNERRAACELAVSILQGVLPGIRALRDVTPQQLDANQALLDEQVYRRARHVVTECARMDQALALLDQGDAAGFGRLMVETHNSLRDDYEVSLPELNTLVELACAQPGFWGARLTGAGFGGCTVNLVQAQQADAFISALKTGYQQHTGRQAEIYLCRASQGVQVKEI